MAPVLAPALSATDIPGSQSMPNSAMRAAPARPSRSRGAGAPSTARTRPGRRPGIGSDLLIASGILAGAAALDVRARAREAERRFPPIGRFLEIDGVRVHCLDRGEGPPVVLLHGNGAMVHDWVLSGLFDRLTKGHRVIAIDRPGFGYTARPRSRVWTPFAQAGLVRGVLRELGIERPVVLGHSWGTQVAVALALEQRAAVAGLVLLGGYYYPTARLDVWAFSPPAIPILGDAVRWTVAPYLTRLMAPRIVAKAFAPRPVPKRFREEFPLGLSLRPSQIRASAADSAMMVPDAALLSRRIGELADLPVTILAGAGDKIATPARQSERLHAELPGSELRLLPGIGHMLHYHAQDEIAEAVAGIAGDGR